MKFSVSRASVRLMILLGTVVFVFFGCTPKNTNTLPDTIISTVDEESQPDLENDDIVSSYIRYQTENGTQVAPVIDIQGRLVHTSLTNASVFDYMNDIKQCGYTRVYIVVPGDGYPVFSAAWNTSPARSFLQNNIKILGEDPLKTFVRHGRNMGLEMIAIYKPYEGGGGITIPEGKEADNCSFYESVPGGQRVYFDSFIQKHPEMRICRRDQADQTEGVTVTAIEIAFATDEIRELTRLGNYNIYPAIDPHSIGNPEVGLWYSADNGTYQQYTGTFDTRWALETRNIYDSNGLLVQENAQVYVLTVSDFDFPDEADYYAVTFSDADRSNLLTLPYSMMTLYSGDLALETSVATYMRSLTDTADQGGTDPDTHIWGAEGQPLMVSRYSFSECISYFSDWGFEFGYGGDGATACGWMKSSVYALTVGKPKYLPGVLCEGYEEVREYWLSYVNYLSEDCGFDGVEIRTLSHSGFIPDVINYGFNEPIVDRYRQIYGINLLDDTVEITEEIFVNIMKIRGEFFTEFLNACSELLHSNGKLFLTEVLSAYADESGWGIYTYDLNQLCSPYQPRILPDWKRCADLSDEIVLKDYYYGIWSASRAEKMKEYVSSQGKDFWIHVYYSYGDASVRFVNAADQDQQITGMLFYEYTGSNQTDAWQGLCDVLKCSRRKS